METVSTSESLGDDESAVDPRIKVTAHVTRVVMIQDIVN